MKNHFVFPYTGNKREEVEEIYKNIDLTNINVICEPFCGSSAISYYISTKHPGKYTYILNDLDKNLTKLYLIMKDEIKTNYFNCMIELLNNYMKKHKTRQEQKYIYDNEFTGVHNYYIKNRYYNIRIGLFPNENNNKYKQNFKSMNAPIIDFLRNEKVIIENEDAQEVIMKYEQQKTLFLLDPPYMMTTNDFYEGYNINIYDYLLDNPQINNYYLILEYTWVIKHLFKQFNVYLYDKKYYGHTKKAVKHCILKPN